MRSESHRNITIDACGMHGVWLDRGELEKIVRKTKGATLRVCQRAAQQAKRKGKYQGILFGWMSLLWE
jgi:Zn-finger nucleic acid-binding protein